MVHAPWHVSDRLHSNAGSIWGWEENINISQGIPSDVMAFLLELKYFFLWKTIFYFKNKF